MKIAIAGAHGLIGTALSASLRARGWDVVQLVRNSNQVQGSDVFWNPESGKIDAARLAGTDAIINFAGESIAERWSEQKKQKIRNSRIKGTQLLSQTAAALEPKPRVFGCASAIGYYGERADEVLKEDSAGGNDFLADVVRNWEAATQPAADAGIRVVNFRFGLVLSTRGGVLARLLVPFQMGAGGRLGSGRQYMSWIAIDDAVSAIEFALDDQSLRGPINVVSPNPVTNNEFTRVLGRVLHRPTFMPVPARMAEVAFGAEMAHQVLLASDRVLPEKLEAAGFHFQYPELQAALAHLIQSHK